MASYFLEVNPRDLRVPTSRPTGADPLKLARQIAKHGASLIGMPPPVVYESLDGLLVVYDGVTRATRAAKLAPGLLIRVEVAGTIRRRYANEPTIGDLLP